MDHSLHYTPTDLAERLVASSVVDEPKAVADFCVGDGRLLAAARVKWPATDLYANDIDAKAASKLGGLRVKRVTCLDFLSRGYFDQFTNFRFDVILLNPPFSAPGRKKWHPIGDYSATSCSLSMAFVLTSFTFLAEGGEILAILPASCMVSDIDRDARSIINSDFEIDILSAPAGGLFPNISASVYTLRLRKQRKKAPIDEARPQSEPPRASINIVRGNISVARSERVVCASDDGWVHTTSLRDGRIVERYQLQRHCSPSARRAPPNSVLIPRVGRFTQGSVVITRANKAELISDCLFAIECESNAMAERVHKIIVDNFCEIRALYIGTGAPYVSTERLRQFFDLRGPSVYAELEAVYDFIPVEGTRS